MKAPAISGSTPPGSSTRWEKASPTFRSATMCSVEAATRKPNLPCWIRGPASRHLSIGPWQRQPASTSETAERVLRLLGVTEGTTLFIDGGAGGVGSAATQIAKARGAMVIASASEANQDYLREIGAIPVVYGEGMVERVQALQIGKVDAVLDAVGKTPIDDLISLTTEPSQVVSIANFGAAASGARVHRRRL